MASTVLIVAVKNPFDPHGSKVTKEVKHKPGRKIREYVAEFFPLAPSDFEIAVSCGGHIVDESDFDSFIVQPGDSLVFSPVPRGGGGGGGGKNILGTIAMMAVMVVAMVYAAPLAAGMMSVMNGGAFAAGTSALALGGSLASAATMLGVSGLGMSLMAGVIGAGIMMVGGMLVNAILPSAKADTGISAGSAVGANFEKSTTYSWDVQSNQVKNGDNIPVLYGSVKIVPPIIARHVTTSGDSQYLNLLLCISESLIDSIEDIQVNDTPYGYFSGISTDIRYGNDSQSPISYFDKVYTDYFVSAKLSGGAWKKVRTDPNSMEVINGPDGKPTYDTGGSTGNWVTQELNGDLITGIGFGIVINGLYYANNKGGLDEQTVRVRAQYRRNKGDWVDMGPGSSETTQRQVTNTYSEWVSDGEGGGYYQDFTRTELVTDTVSYPGTYSVTKADSGTIRQFWSVDGLTPGQYDVRVCREFGPPEASRYGGITTLDYVQARMDAALSYPGLALLGVQALATDQLSGGQPRITCKATRKYVDVYDGTQWLKKDATNPAWICYDIIHNMRIGGAIKTSRIMYSDFKSWADYCEEEGFKCNIYFDSSMSLASALNTVSTIGRGIVVQKGTSFSVIVDRPTEPVQMFTVGNIIAESFNEKFLEKKDRANIVEVSYFDSDRDYTRQIVEVRDASYDTTSEDLIRSQITLYGCTGREQAIRHGKFLLNCNKYLLRTVSFDAHIDAIGCTVGDVVWVQHDLTEWGFGGRIEAASKKSAIIDREVLIEPGKNYRLLVRHQDDDSIEEVALSTQATEPYTTSTLTLVGSWHKVPARDAIYSFGEVDKVAKKFRILSLTRSQELRRKITAIEYFDEIYDDAHEIEDLPSSSSLAGVKGLLVREIWKTQFDGTGQSVVDCTWFGNALSWSVYVREYGKNGPWVFNGNTNTPRYEITDLQPGKTYEICVTDTNPSGGQTATVTLMGKGAPPSDVTGFFAWQSKGDIQMKWNHIPDNDLFGYEIREGASWEKGRTIVDSEQKNTSSWTPPVTGTYSLWIKAIDQSNNYSRNATSFQVVANVDDYINIVSDIDEFSKVSPGDGTKSNIVYISNKKVLALISSLVDTDVVEEDDIDMSSYMGEKFLECEYITQPKDFGRDIPFTLRAVTEIDSNIRHATDVSIMARTDMTYPFDTDLHITSNSYYTMAYRVLKSGTWSDWVNFAGVSDCYGQSYQMKFVGKIDTYSTYFEFNKIRHLADVPEIKQSIKNQTIPVEGKTFLLSDYGIKVFVDYTVGPIVLGGIPFFPTVEKDTDNFTVKLFDKAGNAASGTVDLNFVGY